MEAVQKNYANLQGWRKFISTRRGAITVAVVAAALAGIVLTIFLIQYRSSVTAGVETKTVLIANKMIPKGTSASVVVSGQLMRPGTISSDQANSGAIADASVIAGKVATKDIYPGQQLTAAAFAANADPLRGQLGANERAIAVPVDTAHGLVGDIRSGDRVDVIAGFNSASSSSGRGAPIVKTLMDDILVLRVSGNSSSGTTGGNQNSNVLVRVTNEQAAKIAYASDNGKIWFVLRPPAGGKSNAPSAVTLSSELAGTRPVPTTATGR